MATATTPYVTFFGHVTHYAPWFVWHVAHYFDQHLKIVTGLNATNTLSSKSIICFFGGTYIIIIPKKETSNDQLCFVCRGENNDDDDDLHDLIGGN